MPTINQLIKKNRKIIRPKSKAIALGRGFNSIQNRPIFYNSPFKRGVCTKVTTMTPRKPRHRTDDEVTQKVRTGAGKQGADVHKPTAPAPPDPGAGLDGFK